MGKTQSKDQSGNSTTDKDGYRVVKIQKLDPVKIMDSECQCTEKSWLEKKCRHRGSCACSVLCYQENNKATLINNNNFYGAFVVAYNNHCDIILSPDDIWIFISLRFAKYVNDNAETLRHKFVSHVGKKMLTVATTNQVEESRWDEFFELILQEIQKNTQEGVVERIKCDFSTTLQCEKFISTLAIMNSFKKYFDYGRCIPQCGIQNLRFMGTLDDWKKLGTKVTALRDYAIDQSWVKYIENLTPIIDKFVESYQGMVDVGFWNQIMNFEDGRMGSGGATYVSGWILKFFGLEGKVEVDDIPDYNFDVPVTIINEITNTKKIVDIVGGFGGVYKKDNAYRPQLSYIVYHDGNAESI